jgi:hypothetical protein
VEDLDLREFNHQNAILGLEIEVRPGARPDSKNFRVIFEPAHGMGCEFLCSEIEVASVEAGMPSLSAYA